MLKYCNELFSTILVTGSVFVGGEEQRQLGPSNFLRSYDPDCITYVEHGSKNYCARAKDFRYESKEVLLCSARLILLTIVLEKVVITLH